MIFDLHQGDNHKKFMDNGEKQVLSPRRKARKGEQDFNPASRECHRMNSG
jgi:hypothetical protein